MSGKLEFRREKLRLRDTDLLASQARTLQQMKMETMTARENIVTIGLAGDLISWDAIAANIVAKAGGRPFFLGRRAPCQANDIACTTCKGLLSLVAQVRPYRFLIPMSELQAEACCIDAASCYYLRLLYTIYGLKERHV